VGTLLRHGDVLQLDGGPVRLSVNPRARRISLRVDSRAGLVVATAPSQRTLPQALAFARTRADWMAQRLRCSVGDRKTLQPGVLIPLRGRPVILVAKPGAQAARLDGETIVSGGEGEAFTRRVRRLLRAEALGDLAGRTGAHRDAGPSHADRLGD
jgi:predicted metal-dependent hydrolase